MITIGICDDESIHREYIRELCEQFFEKNTQPHDYVEFAAGEEVLAYQGKQIQLLFLDVEMGEIDGMQVLDSVQSANQVWRVVFVTSHEETVWNAFSLKTLGFARKPVKYEQIAAWLEITMREHQENTVIEYITLDGRKCRRIDEIFYLEAAGNYAYLCCEKEKDLVTEKLKKWQELMEQTMIIRIHKSFLVNLQHIKKWESDKVILENGEILPVGRRFSQIAKESYYHYVKQQALNRGK